MKDFTLKSNVPLVTKEVQAKVQQWLVESGHLILDDSNQTAPIDEGTLVNSGKVVVAKNQVTIGYDTPYAIRQHEDISLRHKNGRKAKFLEHAFTENLSTLEARLESTLES